MAEDADQVGKYKKVKKIGEGSYGVVYRALDTANNRTVALKKIKFSPEDEGIPAHCLREISILKTSHHPNIVKLLDVLHSIEDQKLYLVFEFLDKPLSRLLEEKKSGPINPYLCKVTQDYLELHVPAISRTQVPPLKEDHPQGHQA